MSHSRFVLLFSIWGSLQRAKAEVEATDDDWGVLLLQSGVGLQRQSSVQPATLEQLQADRLAAALPLVFAHVPKTGSSIVNTFLRLPGVCPELAEHLGQDSFSGGSEREQFEVFRDYECPGMIPPPSDNVALVGFHRGLGNASTFDSHYAGHAMTMLRQPEQRVISGLRHRANSTEPAVDIEELRFSAGCTARMFTAEENAFLDIKVPACFGILPDEPDLPEVPEENVTEAVARLRMFAFVGIQEEWPLSVCLLHAMFGGECSAVELGNTRPSPLSAEADSLRQGGGVMFAAPEPYDTSELLGSWVDAADRVVYDAGLEMFHALCEEHGVTEESCEPCYQNAILQ